MTALKLLVAGAAGAVIGSMITGQVLRGQGSDPYGNALVGHVGIAVRDADKAAKRYGEVFNVQVDEARISPLEFPAGSRNMSGKVKIRGFNKGKFRFELIQPLEGSSPHKDFLDQHGEGVQHVDFLPVADYNQMVSHLQSKGGKWILGSPAVNYAYFNVPDIAFTIEFSGPGGARASAPAK